MQKFNPFTGLFETILVSSVSNSDGSLTISPSSGAVIASINTLHINDWRGKQRFFDPNNPSSYGAQIFMENGTGRGTSGTGFYIDSTVSDNFAIRLITPTVYFHQYDGSAALITLDAASGNGYFNGSLTFGAGQTSVLQNDGSISLLGGSILLAANGSASFAGGTAIIDVSGNLTANTLTSTGSFSAGSGDFTVNSGLVSSHSVQIAGFSGLTYPNGNYLTKFSVDGLYCADGVTQFLNSNNQIQIPAGAANGPGLYFAGSTGGATGLYMSSTDFMTIVCGGTPAGGWDNSGNFTVGFVGSPSGANMEIRGTGAQLKISYNSSNHFVPQVSSTGSLTLTLTGTAPTFNFANTIKPRTGSATAGTVPLQFTSGVLLSTAVAGGIEYLTDSFYATITTGAVRKEIVLADTTLVSGRVCFNTTNGRLTDNSSMTFATGVLSLGVSGTIGTLKLLGNTSGTISIIPQAAAGTYNFNLPTSAGSAGQPLLSGGGVAAAQTYGTLGFGGGGTAATSYNTNGVVCVNSSGNAFTSCTSGAGTTYLRGGSSGTPSFQQVQFSDISMGSSQVPVSNGGTNLSSYNTGDILYASGTNTISKLAAVAVGQVLKSNGTSAVPVYGTLNRALNLPIQEAKLPTSNPARIDAAELNWRLLFDAATSQSAQWQFLMPQSYGASLTIRLHFSMNTVQAGTLSVVWRAYIAAITPGDAVDINAKSFASANSATKTLAVNQPAGYLIEQTITMTNADSLAAGDTVMLKIDRDAANGADTGTGDAELIAVTLEWTGL